MSNDNHIATTTTTDRREADISHHHHHRHFRGRRPAIMRAPRALRSPLALAALAAALTAAAATIALPARVGADSSLTLKGIVKDEPREPLLGRICAYGDFNKDRNTDLILQRANTIVVLFQNEQGHFPDDRESRIDAVTLVDEKEVYCGVGDFNGDSALDLMITRVSVYNNSWPANYWPIASVVLCTFPPH